jgi:hypothetical protein
MLPDIGFIIKRKSKIGMSKEIYVNSAGKGALKNNLGKKLPPAGVK